MASGTCSKSGKDKEWRSQLNSAIQDSKLPLFFPQDITKEANAGVVVAVLKAFGENSVGFAYIEPNVSRSTVEPPALLLAHPVVGVCVFEVKGWLISTIQGVQAGYVRVWEEGSIKDHPVFDGASEAIVQIKNATRRMASRIFAEDDESNFPCFNFVIVLPNIRRSEWVSRRYEQGVRIEQLVFMDDLENPEQLRSLVETLVRSNANKRGSHTPAQLNLVRQTIGDSAVLLDSREARPDLVAGTIGYDIDQMARLEKNLSAEQEQLSRADFEGHPQLIRGVAGSGKSVVLANNAANFLIRRLDIAKQQSLSFVDKAVNKGTVPRIGIVCFNRTLVAFLREKVRAAFNQRRPENQTYKTIYFKNLNGFMGALCEETNAKEANALRRVPLLEGDRNWGARAAENYLCQLTEFAKKKPELHASLLFDAIYVDEGQDFRDEEFKLLLSLIKPHPRTQDKSIVIFYDDAQNLYARPRPTWSDIGISVVGGGRSRVMTECFRNTREIVEFAFNVLLGSKASADQKVRTREYADVAYLKEKSIRGKQLIEELEDRWEVHFADRTYNRPPEIHAFRSRQDEKSWVVAKIAWLIEEQQVRSEDILVLFERISDFADLEQLVRARVPSIQGFVKPYGKNPNRDKDSYILRRGNLTLCTIKGAKGYDAYVVFIVGADQFQTDIRNINDINNIQGRASFYVGATRARLMLYVTGCGKDRSLLSEALQVQEMLFGSTKR